MFEDINREAFKAKSATEGTKDHSIKDLMEISGLSRSGVRKYLSKWGFKPQRFEGRKAFYHGDIALEILMEGWDDDTPTSKPKRPSTSEILKEYEERITYLEGKIKSLESRLPGD